MRLRPRRSPSRDTGNFGSVALQSPTMNVFFRGRQWAENTRKSLPWLDGRNDERPMATVTLAEEFSLAGLLSICRARAALRRGNGGVSRCGTSA